MKIIYMAHPVSGDVACNLANAKLWYCYFMRGYAVSILADWIITCEVFDDSDPADRARGLAADLAAVKRADELWLCGPRISSGMQAEAAVAYAAGIPVRSLIIGAQPPGELVNIESYPLWSP